MTGLDTLRLVLQDYAVSDANQLETSQPNRKAATGEAVQQDVLLFKDTSGRGVTGLKAFHNAETFNLTIKPDKRESGTICLLQFSARKVLDGSNYLPADEIALKGALNAIQGHLDSIGVRTSITGAVLSRVDACRNIAIDLPFDAYVPVLSHLKGSRMQRRELGTTYEWGNKSQQITAYDKLQEMQNREESTTGLCDTLRFEHRLLKSQKVKDATGLNRVSDLMQSGALDVVRGNYRDTLSKLFKASVENRPVLSLNDIVAELTHFKDMGSRYWAQGWIKAHGMKTIMQSCDADTLRDAVEIVAGNRVTAGRVLQSIEQAKADAISLQRVKHSNRTVADLYAELQSKALA